MRWMWLVVGLVGCIPSEHQCTCGTADSTAVPLVVVPESVVPLPVVLPTVPEVGPIGTTAPWSLVRNFNNGPVGTSVNGKADGMTTTTAVYDNTHSVDGGMAAKTTVEQGKSGFGFWGGVISFPSSLQRYDELWLQVWLYVPSDFRFDTNSGSLKFVRIRSTKEDGSHTGYLDWQIRKDGTFRMIKEGQNAWFFAAPSAVMPKGKWSQFIYHITFDNVPGSAGGKSRVRVWQDGALIQDENKVKTMTAETDRQTALYLFTYWNGGGPQTQSAWIDDVRMAANQVPEWARCLE